VQDPRTPGFGRKRKHKKKKKEGMPVLTRHKKDA
jgi:hypothetical protein